MQFTEKQLLKENGNARFYRIRKYLYKLYKHYIDEPTEDQVIYNHLISPKVDKHIILPKELLYNEHHWLIGYKMDYIDGIDLEQEISNPQLSYEDKVLLINEFFQLLRKIHQYLVVGDIRNSNLMVGKDNNAYMIDFDFAQKISSSAIPFCRYHITHNGESLNDKNEDIIKMYISALSLLYSWDIEESFIQASRDGDSAKLSQFIPLSGFLRDYYYYMLECLHKHQNIKDYLQLPFDSTIEEEVNTARSRILNK